MKLVTINGVEIKALGKVKMTYNTVFFLFVSLGCGVRFSFQPPPPLRKDRPLAAMVKSPFGDSCLYVCYYVFLNFKAIRKQEVFVQSLTSI